ncbi:MAG: methionine/alanine import NSS transporter subunit MetS [Corynebacterium sp.]|nr:methionine/alanine import NSS transporter subunit MetS [Corynebacterium sp.]
MTGPAIMMMVLFMVVIWGGLAASCFALRRNPDESSGIFGESEFATDDILIEQEK